MDSKKNEFKKYLLKFEHIKIIYITPKMQYWGISDQGVKKCIVKNVIDIEVLEDFLKKKKIISYENSKLFKKNISVEIQNIRKQKQKQRYLEFKKENQKFILEIAAKYTMVYITPKMQYWGITDTGFKKCLIKNISDVKMLDNFLSDKKIISYTDSKLYISKPIAKNSKEMLEGLQKAFAKLEIKMHVKMNEPQVSKFK